MIIIDSNVPKKLVLGLKKNLKNKKIFLLFFKASEKNNCQTHNFKELSRLLNLKVIVALGEVAYRQIIKLYGIKLNTHKFKHGNVIKLNKGIYLISSYHCSKLNINTRKINKSMLKRIFLRAIKLSYNG